MAAAEKGKKKRAPLSSFTILLIILVVLADCHCYHVRVAASRASRARRFPGVLTAPVFGFQDAIGVCLFVMILGGFLGIVTETGALDAGIAARSCTS